MPIEPAAFTRREFLRAGSALLSTATTVPTFLAHCGAALAGESDHASGRILVVVQLSGGNDGLNTVVPFGDPAYHRARPRLAIPEKEVIALDTHHGIGLHPALRDLVPMLGQGRAAIVQAVGYPNPNRSHFASMDVWHSGDTRGGRGRGWIGQGLDQTADGGGAMACICIGSEAPMAARGRHAKPVALDRAELFRWVGSDLHPELARTYAAVNRQARPAADDAVSFVWRTALDAQATSDRIRRALGQAPVHRFPSGNLARQLEMVAALIRAELPTRVYYVALGGFDTHANQRPVHERLLGEFGRSVQAFYRELEATGHDRRVLTLAFSEFGRRVAQNASGGTDHGTAAPVFLFGESVQPGLQGVHPSLEQLDGGDLVHGLDFRCIYTELLEDWLGLDAGQALGGRFARAGVLRKS